MNKEMGGPRPAPKKSATRPYTGKVPTVYPKRDVGGTRPLPKKGK